MYCKLAEKNNELEPKPFQIILSRGSVRKSFLVTAITEYLRAILRYPSQSFDNPSVLVTASTGRAAANVNGIYILHLTSLLNQD